MSVNAPTAQVIHNLRQRRMWWIVAALVALAWAADLWRVWQVTNFHDLDVFLLAGRRVLAGQDIYADTKAFQQLLQDGTFSLKDSTVVWPYANPPLIALLMAPATHLPYDLFKALWWGLGAASLALGSWLTVRGLGHGGPESLVLALLPLVWFEPATSALRLGQIEPVQFLLMAYAFLALTGPGRRWIEATGGMALGVAAGLKFFPGALIALLIWRRRWWAAGWAIAAAAVSIIVPALVVGVNPADYMAYASIYGIGGAYAAFPLNQSLNGVLSRNLVHNVFTATLWGVHRPGLAKALTLGGSAALIACSAWLTWGRGRQPGEDERPPLALAYALGVMALLIVSPHSQIYAFVWALIPMLVVASAAPLGTRRGAWIWLGLAAAYVLIGRKIVFFYPGVTRFVQAHAFWGSLLLWALVAGLIWHARRRRGARPESVAGG